MNNRIGFGPALALVAGAFFVAAAHGQPAPPADPGAPPAPRVQSANGVDYLSGGAGEEARAEMARQGAGFPLRIVFSVAGGAYTVADHVDLSNAGGKLLAVDGAGPLLMVKVGPGDYTVEVRQGGKTERRPIHLGAAPVTLNWRLPDSTAPR